MAVLDLSVTIADDQLPRLMAAARAALGAELTDEQVVEAIRQHGIALMKQMVRNYERKVAIMQAEALDPQIEVI